MVRIAVTGGIACGKSLVGVYLREHGLPVCDTDELAHEGIRRGGVAYDAVVEAFGAGCLGADGDVDRQVLGALVFEDAVARQRLNAIVHPHVMAAVGQWLVAQEAKAEPAVAVLVPLLFEAGLESGWDAIVCITSPGEQQIARLRARGLDDDAAHARVAAQWPNRRKVALSDFVIVNDGTKAMLKKRTAEVLASIVER